MERFLRDILDHKRQEVARLRGMRSAFCGRTAPKRPFVEALDKRPALAVVAEVKKASPSKGVIRDDFDPAATASAYERGGAAAISVLTDEKFFQGSASFLTLVREMVGLPVLRKDFIIDPLQVAQTAHLNADAMLLIVAALSDAQMDELFHAAAELDIDAFVEAHTEAEVERALDLHPRVIGINNRDLATFVTDPGVTLRLLRYIPPEVTVVSESGITTGKQTRELLDAGVRAVLVGEALMRSDDPAGLLKELSHAHQD